MSQLLCVYSPNRMLRQQSPRVCCPNRSAEAEIEADLLLVCQMQKRGIEWWNVQFRVEWRAGIWAWSFCIPALWAQRQCAASSPSVFSLQKQEIVLKGSFISTLIQFVPDCSCVLLLPTFSAAETTWLCYLCSSMPVKSAKPTLALRCAIVCSFLGLWQGIISLQRTTATSQWEEEGNLLHCVVRVTYSLGVILPE